MRNIMQLPMQSCFVKHELIFVESGWMQYYLSLSLSSLALVL
jgi:hypothetical protein